MTESVIDTGPAIIDRLTELLERLIPVPRVEARENRAEIIKLKLPQYNGEGDVAFFLQQFEQIADTSGWGEAIRILKIREVLVGKAQECGRGTDLQTIFANLRIRFGITQREARSKLRVLRKDPKSSLQVHATEVERLVNLAHPNLPRLYIQDLVLETFTSSLGYSSLQKHLLAMRIETLDAAVQAGNAFLELSNTFHKSNDVRQMDENVREDIPIPSTAVVENPINNVLGGMMDILNKLVSKIDNMGKRTTQTTTGPNVRQPPTCWSCGEIGHVRSKCKTSSQPITSN